MTTVVMTSPPIVRLGPEDVAVLEAAGATVVERVCLTEDDLLEACADADGIVTLDEPFTARVIEGLRRCRVIARLGIGVDKVDLAAAARAGIVVTNVPDYCVDEVADHAIALLLAVARGIVRLDAAAHGGNWDTPSVAGPVRRLRGRTLGVVGFGRTGRLVASRGAALGMEVLAHDPALSDADVEHAGAQPLALDDLLSRSDAVSLHVPLTPETRRLLSRERIASLRPGAIVVNTSRGGLVDEAALVEALQAGRLFGAGLDVFENEPLPADSPLLTLPNVVLTTHAAHWSLESSAEQRRHAVANVANVLQGKPARNPVPLPEV